MSKDYEIPDSMGSELKKVYQQISRRRFLMNSASGLGGIALNHLFNNELIAATLTKKFPQQSIEPKVKRVVYLFMAGGPSQLETFDYKPKLISQAGRPLPDSIRKGQRLTGMSANQSILPIAPPRYEFKRHGKSKTWVSELMPHTARVVDELCIIKSLYTEAINHDPAITFFQTGNQLPGRPSIGSWISYGLGSENKNLPAFIVLVSKDAIKDQPLYARLWGNGFLPSEFQGVQFKSGKDPVLFLNDPQDYHTEDRREMLDYLAQLNKLQNEQYQDPEVDARIAQYELAYRMQSAVPDVIDMKNETRETFELYGEASRNPGTYAANCLLARKLLEKDVRFIQLYHQGWDHHGSLPSGIEKQFKATDQATAALITDLKRRGLLEDTLVVWGGEFGRTVYSQGKLTPTDYGRDHHPRCFSMWMAGAGVRAGLSYGETDDFSYNIINNPVHVHDFQATLLHLMGIDHESLTFKFQGRRYRLTDVHGKVVHGILS